jgi:hypothetical protein
VRALGRGTRRDQRHRRCRSDQHSGGREQYPLGRERTRIALLPRHAGGVAFHDQMRKLWEDHVTWTRLTIVSAVGGTNGEALSDTGPTLARLQQNQDDIGAAIAPYFGQAAGDQLAVLLHEHISGAVTLVLAAKAGDEAGVAAAKATWYANGQQIADFLAAANPRFWPQDTMRDAMQTHLDQTLQKAVDRLQGNHAAEIQDYEHAHLHILQMADLLSSGIIRKFRGQFDEQ